MNLQPLHNIATPRLFIFGLDAATWDLIRPWAAAGDLPNLARLTSEGVSGDLQSAIPPLTPPAWTSFMTGCNPGKHGVYNFLEPQEGSYAMRYSNAGSRRSATLWQVLNEAGCSTGVINVPFTYPPEPLAGFQISGMDTPNEKSAFVHPPELRSELENALGNLKLEIRYLGAMSSDARRDEVLKGLAALDEQWSRIALHTLEHHPCDAMMLTFMSIDTVQHYFWHYMDPAHFLHDAKGAGRYRDAIKQVYQRLDAAVGRILERLPEDCTVLVLSDHGGGQVSDRVLYLNRYFAQWGLLAYRQEPGRNLGRRILRRGYDFLRSSLSSDQKKWIAHLVPSLVGRVENAATSFSNIDWPRTKAYCSEVLAYPPSVFINEKGARPEGIVEPAEREELLALLTEKLSALRDPRDGSPIIPRIYRREELFQGPCAAQGPELVLDWWSGAGFSVSPSLAEEAARPPLEIRERKPMDQPEWSGTHRLQGIMILRGAAARKGGRIEGARLVDMMPTLLYLLGVPIPPGLDGRVLTEALEPAYLQAHPLQQSAAGGATTTIPQSTPYSAEESAEVEERLKALGYVD